MTSVKRLHQIVAKLEAQSGAGVSGLAAAANSDFYVIDPQLTFDPEQFTRANINRGGSLSPFVPLAGVSPGQASFGFELSGILDDGAWPTVPSWSIFLRACGMVEANTKRLTIGAVSGGPIFSGELLTQAVSGATAYAVHQHSDGNTTLIIRDDSGTFNGTNLVTGGTSGATFTPTGAAANDGVCWYPTGLPEYLCTGCTVDPQVVAGHVFVGNTSDTLVIATRDYNASGTVTDFFFRPVDGGELQSGETLDNKTSAGDDVVVGTVGASNPAPQKFGSLGLGLIEEGAYKELKGARGSFSIGFELGGPMIANCTFTGLRNSLADRGAIPVTSYTPLKPKGMIGITFTIGDDTITTDSGRFSPRIHSFSFDQGQTVGIGRDANESLGLYGAAWGIGREPSGSMTISINPESEHAIVDAVQTGAIQNIEVEWQNSATDAFKMTFPGATLTGEASGEDNGIGTRDLSIQFGSYGHGGTEIDAAECVLSYTNY